MMLVLTENIKKQISAPCTVATLGVLSGLFHKNGVLHSMHGWHTALHAAGVPGSADSCVYEVLLRFPINLSC